MSIGVWTDHGVVIAPVSSDTPGQPNVLYETGAKILSGTVFKMWFGTINGVCYAESTDGLSWTRYSSNPIVSTAQQSYPKIYKSGSTYYLFTSIFGGNMGVYTSTDGVTFSLQNANALILGSQAWEHTFIGQLGIVTILNGTWHGYYTSKNTGGAFAIGHATSPDGINWTKDAANPVLTAEGPSNLFFATVNNAYYGWSQIQQPGIPNNGDGILPSDISRYWATNPAGPWTILSTSTIYRTQTAEGYGLITGQIADPCILAANGNLYMYTTVETDGNSAASSQIGCAIASSTTLAQLVSTYEGVTNIPIPTATGLALQLPTLASDNFQRANANPIGGNWSPGGFGNNEIVSDAVIPSLANTEAHSYWNPITWNANQWAQITVAACSQGSSLGVSLRTDSSAQTAYILYWSGTLGGAAQVFRIGKWVAGSFTPLASSGIGYIVNVADVLTASAIGTTLSFYQNSNLVLTTTDASIASGSAGFVLNSGTNANTAVSISAWAGGSVQNGGTPPGPPAASVYSVPDCRDYSIFPNTSVNVNGTLTYTVQTGSRKAGAPVDSRTTKPTASGTYPQNSRTPGTFGPGE